MKKTLILTAFMALSSITGYASTVVVTFSANNVNPSGTTTPVAGLYFAGKTGTVNQVKTGDGGGSYTSSSLTAFDGTSTGITLVTGAGACGNNGYLRGNNIKDSHDSNNTNKFFDVFGMDMAVGQNYGGCINKESGGFTMQLQGLSSGSYTLTMLVGRNNVHGTASSTYSLSGVTGVSVNVLDYSTGISSSIADNAVTLDVGQDSNLPGEWALVEYTFTSTTDNTTLSLNINGTGNIGALALASVPEPATASLGLLGLGVLLMRRRRA